MPSPLSYDWVDVYGTKCLEVAAFDTSDTALISQHDCNGGPHQNWRFIPSRISGPPALAAAYGGTFLLQNEYTGKCLTLAGPQTYNGVAIMQRPCYTAGLLQLWWLLSVRGAAAAAADSLDEHREYAINLLATKDRETVVDVLARQTGATHQHVSRYLDRLAN